MFLVAVFGVANAGAQAINGPTGRAATGSLASPGANPTANSASVRVLTTTRSVLALSHNEAEKNILAHIVGQVVYADPNAGLWFLRDETAGISLSRPSPATAVPLGSLVEVEGASRMNGFDVALEERRLKILGTAPLPPATPITVDQLIDVLTDFQWVEMESVVESVRTDGSRLSLILSGARDIRATIPGFPAGGLVPTNWVDARLRMRGVWTTRTTPQGKYKANYLYIPSMDQVQVVSERKLEASQIPVQPIERALRFNAHAGESRRIKVVGAVTAVPTEHVFYIQEGSVGVRVYIRDMIRFGVGDRVEVVGFPAIDGVTPQLEEASVRVLGRTVDTVPVLSDPAGESLEDGRLEGVLTRVEGETVGVVRGRTLAELVVRVGEKYVAARLPGTNAVRDLASFKPASRVRLTGVSVLLNGNSTLANRPQLILRSLEDVVLLQREPWWTVPKAMAVFAGVSALLLYWRLVGWRRESRMEHRYRMIFENASELVGAHSLDGAFLEANPAWVNLSGYSLEDLRKRPLREMVAPPAALAFEVWWRSVASGGVVADHQFELATRSGQLAQVEIRGRLVNAGELTERVESFGRDVTARRKAEQQQMRLATIVEFSDDAIIGNSMDGLITSWNRGAEVIFGYAPNEAIGHPLLMLCPPDRVQEEAQILARISRGEIVRHFETVRVRKDGKQIKISATISPLKDGSGQVTGASKIARDITERKLAEEALQMMRFSVDHAGDSVFWFSREGRIRYANDAACSARGYTREEILNLTIFDLDPEYQPGVWESHWEELKQRGTMTLDARHRTRDGRVLFVEVNDNYVHFGNEELNFAFVRDITARTEQEAERRKLEAQLRQSQKMEAIGTLAGGIAHDFNNILGAIVGNTDLALLDLDSSHPAARFLAEIRSASDRAAALVRQILSFSRKELRKVRTLSLASPVSDAARLLRTTLPAGVELLTCFDDAPLVLADPTEIHQVLLNLGTNAWHSMEGRPGQINVTVEAVTIDAAFARTHADLRPGSYARLTVTDTGKGMDAATIEHIFDPFYTTKEVGKGTGLGLSVVHGIIRSHQGAIIVKSQPGRGTAFELYFPTIQPERSNEAAPVAPHSSASGQNHRILFLDDEEPLVTVTTVLLERRGYQVRGFTRVADALEAFRSDPGAFDLVVTDYNMPGSSGLDVAREIQKLRPGLPVIVTSGFITENLRLEAASAGVRHITAKPFSVDEICRTIQLLISSPSPSVASNKKN